MMLMLNGFRPGMREVEASGGGGGSKGSSEPSGTVRNRQEPWEHRLQHQVAGYD